MIENIHRGVHLSASETIRAGNSPAVEQLSAILERGTAQKLFKPDIAAQQLHWKISALCFFNVSNEPTFSGIFGNDLMTEAGQAALRQDVVDTIVGSVLA